MTDEADVNIDSSSSEPSDVNSAPSAEPAPQPEKKDSKSPNAHREALIAKLTANKEQAPADAEEPSEDGEDLEQPDASTTTQPASTSEEPEAEKAPAPAAEPGDDLLTEQDKTHGRGAQARIRELARKVKESEGLAGFGADILGRAQKAGIPPQVFADWVDTGADIFSNPQVGVQKLIAMAESLGYKAPAPAAAVPEGLDKLLTKLETDLDISAEAAQAIRARFKTAEPAPVAAPPAPQVAPQAPRIDANRAVEAQATQQMNQIAANYAKAMPGEWAAVELEAAKELEAFKGSNPAHWPRLFQNAVELVLARRKAAVQKTTTPTRTLRPTTAPPGKEAPKSNRERVLSKYT